MTQDEIIRMMKEAGFYIGKDDEFHPEWERFAALVAAHEREKQAEQNPIGYVYNEEDYNGSVIRRGKRDSSWVPVYTIPISIEAAVLAERKACANVCEEEAEEWAGRTEPHEAVVRCAAAIRARSNT